jgi:ribosome-binding ATPase YchF (GTP1/OBG family)
LELLKEFDDFCDKKEQTKCKPAHKVNVVELELCLSEAELVDVALTRAQRAKAGQMLTDEDVTEREPR